MDTNETNAFAELLERMLAIQQQQAQALHIQTERTTPKENPNYKPNSLFIDPDTGLQWGEKLKCDIYLASMKLNRTPITKDEWEALNKLQPVEKAPVTKTDGSTVRIDVVPTENAVTGAIERLTIKVDLKKDQNPQHLPSLRVLALQLAAAEQPVR